MKQNQPMSGGGVSLSTYTKRGRAKIIDPSEAVYGGHYDLAEFIAAYGLTPLEAREIFIRIGPTRTDLDRYMQGRRSSVV
ncbi:hypothetical protein [Ensifer adhaerens]|uniref:hypothetical protein n=1 Tax=Ensifer adhaerens TaxID=106592 RepID=UPI001C4E10DC|nr:hypothetical protein [Ensifer adhaerens]MBW0370961.1 hypothetical protein [Ensifer adhaerens]UCM23908.1 hypothetical protein LDL63_29540 [Ensifer adhaerens]